MGTCLQKNGYPFRQLLKKTHYQNDIRQLLKIPRFGMIEGHSLKLLRALRFFLKPFYFFFNRIARYAQSKESRNLLKKIPQITCKAIFRNCHYRTSIMYALALCVGKHFANRMICIENTALNTINSTNKLLCCFLCRFSQKNSLTRKFYRPHDVVQTTMRGKFNNVGRKK